MNKKKYLKKHKKKHKLFKNFIGGYKNYIQQLDEIFHTKKEESIENSVNTLETILDENNVSHCHGIEHAKQVMYHAWRALEYYDISDENKLSVLMAALLHDADDHKFFKEHKNYENLRKILKSNGKSEKFIEKVVYMVSIVSSSKNGDTIPPEIIDKEWMLIPRYADRIEAIGIIGIERCFTYTKHVRIPYYLTTSPRAKTEEDIWKIATKNRYDSYNGNSVSMIDHYYDKLLRLSTFPIENPYFDEECKIRRKPLIDFLIFFGITGDINDGDIINFLNITKAPISIEHE